MPQMPQDVLEDDYFSRTEAERHMTPTDELTEKLRR